MKSAMKLAKYFAELDGNRQQGKIKHLLTDIIVMCIIAIACSCKCFIDIESFLKSKIKYLRKNLGMDLKNGIPSHDTIKRVMASCDPEKFSSCFINFVKSLRESNEGDFVSIDWNALNQRIKKVMKISI
ncbi:MAG: ISAs1 family transposase [Christensenellaceae bacterium]|jgi:hypothetical protein|nr:ISAs1 family transposase [Christensenellaceae bacterium]